jgi:hypothetical protein
MMLMRPRTQHAAGRKSYTHPWRPAFDTLQQRDAVLTDARLVLMRGQREDSTYYPSRHALAASLWRHAAAHGPLVCDI